MGQLAKIGCGSHGKLVSCRSLRPSVVSPFQLNVGHEDAGLNQDSLWVMLLE